MSVINTVSKSEFATNATNSDKVVLVDFLGGMVPTVPCHGPST